MAIPQKVIKFLDSNKIKYKKIEHRTVYTAFDKAATLKVKPNIVGKTLALRADKDLVLALLSGSKNLDRNKFRKIAKARKVDFISETVMKNKFKGFKIARFSEAITSLSSTGRKKLRRTSSKACMVDFDCLVLLMH